MSTKFNPILSVRISLFCIKEVLIVYYWSSFTIVFYTAGDTNALTPLPNSYTRTHKTIKFGMLVVHQIFGGKISWHHYSDVNFGKWRHFGKTPFCQNWRHYNDVINLTLIFPPKIWWRKFDGFVTFGVWVGRGICTPSSVKCIGLTT